MRAKECTPTQRSTWCRNTHNTLSYNCSHNTNKLVNRTRWILFHARVVIKQCQSFSQHVLNILTCWLLQRNTMLCVVWDTSKPLLSLHTDRNATAAVFSSTLWTEQLLYGETSSSPFPLSCSLQLELVSMISSWEIRKECPIEWQTVRPGGRGTRWPMERKRERKL